MATPAPIPRQILSNFKRLDLYIKPTFLEMVFLGTYQLRGGLNLFVLLFCETLFTYWFYSIPWYQSTTDILSEWWFESQDGISWPLQPARIARCLPLLYIETEAGLHWNILNQILKKSASCMFELRITVVPRRDVKVTSSLPDRLW